MKYYRNKMLNFYQVNITQMFKENILLQKYHIIKKLSIIQNYHHTKNIKYINKLKAINLIYCKKYQVSKNAENYVSKKTFTNCETPDINLKSQTRRVYFISKLYKYLIKAKFSRSSKFKAYLKMEH